MSSTVGPENTTVMVFPSKDFFEEGSNVTLFCSAESTPEISENTEFRWFWNGEYLHHQQPELKLNNISLAQSGNYTCQTFNVFTKRYDMSEVSSVAVVGVVGKWRKKHRYKS